MRSKVFATFQGLLVLGIWMIICKQDGRAQTTLHVSPATVTIDNLEATQQVLSRSSKSSTDLTRRAIYEILDPKIAAPVWYNQRQKDAPFSWCVTRQRRRAFPLRCPD